MSKIYFLLINFIVLLKFSKSDYKCRIVSNNIFGIGCEIDGAIIHDGDDKIEIPQGNGTTMNWIQIQSTQFLRSPKFIFKKFNNLERIFITDSTGFEKLQEPYLDHRISSLVIRNTDLEVVSEINFRELLNLTTVSLNFNEIHEVQSHAFDNLLLLETLELTHNKIESLENDLLKNNINLVRVALNNNLIKTISAQLFSRNTKLKLLMLQSNEIIQIEENFLGNKSLDALNLYSNICVDAHLMNTNPGMMPILSDCQKNYELMKVTNEAIEVLDKKANVVEEKTKEALDKINSDLTIIEAEIDDSKSKQTLNILEFFEREENNIRSNFASVLTNFSLELRANTTNDMEEMIVFQAGESQKRSTKKTVADSFTHLRKEFERKLAFIYCTAFFILFLLIVIVIILLRHYKNNQISSEV